MSASARALGQATSSRASRGWIVGLLLGALAGVVLVAAEPMLVVALLAFVVLAAMVVWMPGALLAAYLLIPIYKATVQPYLPVDLTLVLAAANALQVVAVVRQPRTGLSTGSLFVWLALSAVITAGALYAPDQQQALGVVAEWWLLVVAPLVAAIRVASQRRYVVQFIAAVAALGLVALGLAVNATILVPTAGRVQVLDNTIQSARAILLLPVIATTWFLVSPSRRIWAALPIIGLGLAGALATGSRGPLLMFLVTIAIAALTLAARGHGWRRPALLASAAAVVIFGAIAIGLVPEASMARIGLLFGSLTGESSGDSIDSRVEMAQIAFTTFETNPLVGVGAAGYSAITGGDPSTAGFDYPHNTVLQAAAEFGAIGALLVGGLVIVALLRPIRNDPVWAIVRVMALFFALNALVSGGLYDERMLWGLVFLLLCAPQPDSVHEPVQPAAAGA